MVTGWHAGIEKNSQTFPVVFEHAHMIAGVQPAENLNPPAYLDPQITAWANLESKDEDEDRVLEPRKDTTRSTSNGSSSDSNGTDSNNGGDNNSRDNNNGGTTTAGTTTMVGTVTAASMVMVTLMKIIPTKPVSIKQVSVAKIEMMTMTETTKKMLTSVLTMMMNLRTASWTPLVTSVLT